MSRARRQRQGDPKPGRLDGKSPIKAAVLMVLLEAPGHGYDVAKRVNQRMGGWAINPKHIYELLKQLEMAGLVRSCMESIEEPPGLRKVFYPTEAARQARQDWFASRPAAVSVLRADIHARIAFSTESDASELIRALAEYRADLLEEIALNAMRWAAPQGSWLGLALGSLRTEVDKLCKAEMDWVNEISKDLEERSWEGSR